MDPLETFDEALNSLARNIENFPIGAVALDDSKPIDEKIRDSRDHLKEIERKILVLKSKISAQSVPEATEESLEKSESDFNEGALKSVITKKAMELCLNSMATKDIAYGNIHKPKFKERFFDDAKAVFKLNDHIWKQLQVMSSKMDKRRELLEKCEKALRDYLVFLQKQEETRKKKLQEINPAEAKEKELLQKTIRKINYMKRLIMLYLSSSSSILKDHPEFAQYFEKHIDEIRAKNI